MTNAIAAGAVVAEAEVRGERADGVGDRAVQPQAGAAVAVVDDLDLAQVDLRRAAAAGPRREPDHAFTNASLAAKRAASRRASPLRDALLDAR